MAKYRSKPVEIEATQFLGQPVEGVFDTWDMGHTSAGGFVITIHGQRTVVSYGDYIITEPDGEHHYPCKPDIFERRYEPAQS